MCQVFLIQPQIVFHRAAAAVLQFKIIESVYVWLLDALNCPRGKSFLPLGPNNPLQPQKTTKKKHREKTPTSLIPVTHLFSARRRCVSEQSLQQRRLGRMKTSLPSTCPNTQSTRLQNATHSALSNTTSLAE